MKRIPFIVAIILYTCSCNDKNGNNPASIELELDKSTSSDSKKETSVMLLGTYHFNNPGQDSFNMEVDDYSTDKRQEEIRALVDLLAKYKPTKIFLEFPAKSQIKMDSLYNIYLNGEIAISQIKGGINEIYQVGFRLGKKVGGAEIIGVDHNGNWLAPYADYLADTLGLTYYKDHAAAYGSKIKDEQEKFLSHTVSENLIYTNELDQIKQNHNYYNNIAIKVKDTAGIMFTFQEDEQEINGMPYYMRSFDFNNIGVELVAEWYKRNLFIYRNIIENSEANDRVVIIIGSGHVFYLNQLLSNNPKFKLIKPIELLAKTKNRD
uniref:DUF5694 domain-containing protein n=1 Tax=Fulvivirga sp. TaxID=1931237 RepID=UPI00404AAFAB